MQDYRWYKFTLGNEIWYFRNCTHAEALHYRERGEGKKPLNFSFASKKEMAENDLTDSRENEKCFPKRRD